MKTLSPRPTAASRSFEDYPPWTTVADIWDGVFVGDSAGPHSGEYTVEWLPEPERGAQWAALGVNVEDSEPIGR